MLSSFASVLLFIAVGIVFIYFTLFLSSLIRPKGTYSHDKFIPYECGEVPEGSAWIQFNIRFYVFALIFIIFDVEVIFLLPWAVVFKSLGSFAFIEGLIFVGILVVGLAYVWRKGDLAWVKPSDVPRRIGYTVEAEGYQQETAPYQAGGYVPAAQAGKATES